MLEQKQLDEAFQKLSQDVASYSKRFHSQEVKVIAVSKTMPASMVNMAVKAGFRRFGENRVQEALEKIPQVQGNDLEWHLIGSLQTNKARFCPQHFQWLHSLDSIKLAKRLNQHFADANQTLNVLIQVNVSQEDSKHGLDSWEEVLQLSEFLQECPALKLKGLMGIAGLHDDEKGVRQSFSKLYQWQNQLQSVVSSCTELSMGMSHDYLWALEEGATMVRIGSAIFGRRSP